MANIKTPYDEKDLELLAYVDGFLDRDPVRKANMERHLRENPDELETVRAYQAQNEALRRAYAESLPTPPPERLLDVVNADRRPRLPTVMKSAAVVAMMLAASATGWGVATQQSRQETLAENFIDQIHLSSTDERDGAAREAASPANHQATAEQGLAPVSFRLAVPDLSDMGYSIVNQEMIKSPSGPVTKLAYAAPDGQEFNLYLRARWDERDERMQVRHDGDLSIVLWLDGPVASAVVSKLPTEKAERIARIVRTTMLRRSQVEPLFQSPNAPRNEAAGTWNQPPVVGTAPTLEGAAVTDNTSPVTSTQTPTAN